MKRHCYSKFLHDFREYCRTPRRLADGLAEYYTSSRGKYATVARLGDLSDMEVDTVVEQAVKTARARRIPNLSVICTADTSVAARLKHLGCKPWTNLHCTLIEEKVPSKPRASGDSVVIRSYDSQSLLRFASVLGRIMKKCIIGQGTIDMREVKGAAVYTHEIRRYANCVGIAQGWVAFGVVSRQPVGFSMCSTSEDDIGDTLGIGTYFLPGEAGRIWNSLVDHARVWLAAHDGRARITTWGDEIGHYRDLNMKESDHYQIVDVPLDEGMA